MVSWDLGCSYSVCGGLAKADESTSAPPQQQQYQNGTYHFVCWFTYFSFLLRFSLSLVLAPLPSSTLLAAGNGRYKS
jgi:hypothetical protein